MTFTTNINLSFNDWCEDAFTRWSITCGAATV